MYSNGTQVYRVEGGSDKYTMGRTKETKLGRYYDRNRGWQVSTPLSRCGKGFAVTMERLLWLLRLRPHGDPGLGPEKLSNDFLGVLLR